MKVIKQISLGLDLSTTSSGYSVFEDDKLIAYGVIKPNGKDWRDRIADEMPKIDNLIEHYKPNVIYVEDVPLKAGNSKILVILGAVQGALISTASCHNVPIHYIQPSRWRSPLGLYDGTRDGTKRAELKRKSVEMANKLFGLSLRWVSPSSKKNDDDISDSVLLCYSQVGHFS